MSKPPYLRSRKDRIKNLEVRFLQWLEHYNKSHILGKEREDAFQFFKDCESNPSAFYAWVKPAFYFDDDSDSLLQSFRSVSTKLTNRRIAELEDIIEKSKIELNEIKNTIEKSNTNEAN